MNSVLSINEAPTRIARTRASNLVKLSGTPDVGQSLAQTPTSSNPPSRNQRCFRYLDCFDGGFGMGHSPVEVRFLTNSGRRAWFKSMRPTFKAVYLSSQFDRILSLNKATTVSSGAAYHAPCPVGVCRIDWAAQLTQTRHGVSVNKYQAGS